MGPYFLCAIKAMGQYTAGPTLWNPQPMSTPQPPFPPQAPPPPPHNQGTPDALLKAKAAAEDALKVFMQLIYNPVGAIPSAFASLNSTQAVGVGVVFTIAFALCVVLAGSTIVGSFLPGAGTGGFRGFLLILLSSFGFAAGVAGGNFAARSVLKGTGNFGFDAFSAGAALLPLGLGFLATAILGVVGISGPIGSVPLIVGVSLLVLVLFTGLTRVAGIKEGPASYVVGFIMVLGSLGAYVCTRMGISVLF
jgi:hypothetical protein